MPLLLRLLLQKLRWAASYVCGLPVQQYASARNGPLEVEYRYGRKVLNSASANYSYGSLHRIFQLALPDSNVLEAGRILLLGMGAGSVIRIIREEYGLPTPLTAVENDPVVVQIAEAHFGLGAYANLQVVTADAFAFVARPQPPYDLLIVDLFQDQEVPPQLGEPLFYEQAKRLLQPGGCLLLNLIVTNAAQQQLLSSICGYLGTEGQLHVRHLLETNAVVVWHR